MKAKQLTITPEETWGWKNTATGTICQNVIKESPQALFKDAGLDVPEDPTKVTKHGFQAVPVRLVGIVKKEVQLTKTKKHKWDQMVIEEVKS